MRVLYPEVAPFRSLMLDAGASHQLYVEESGAKEGIPLVFLHGGPGSGCNENHRRYFDPSKYRIVIFDQRGCHRSSPRGAIQGNTTLDLLDDIERIRRNLAIEHWAVFGGSWGATLGLLYAQRHPDRVLALILRGVFLARQRDLDWFAREGANRIFPDHWQDVVQHFTTRERRDLVNAYYARMHDGNADERRLAARTWSAWAGRIATYLLPQAQAVEEDIERLVHQVAIETHYAHNRYFIAENQILDNAGRMPGVPTRIIHGRRDLVCTLDSSWELHRALPRSELTIVNDGGHLASEAVMTDALISATDEFAGRL